MFYDKLLNLCKEYGVKPTPTLKGLGISPGNLKRWETGASVNSETLEKLADYFDVPIDYFFLDESNAVEITDDSNSVRKIYSVLRAYPDHIASMCNGSTITADELKIIAEYMNCSVEYLLNGSDESPAKQRKAPDLSFLSKKDLVLEVLSRLATSKAYKAVQVNISRIIINNLAKLNVTRDKLLEIKLAKKKIADLYSEKPATSICGLNNSDLIRISRAYSISYDFMFTGQN